MKADFSQLYSRLDLHPGCTLAEFRHAYRQRIGELHPDRGADPRHHDELSDLLRLYTTAIRFHRRHGRLPGAPSRHAARHATRTPSHSNQNHARARVEPTTSTPPKWPVAFSAVLVSVMIALAFSWDWQVDSAVKANAGNVASTTASSFTPVGTIDALEPDVARPQRLESGMSPSSVLAIQGKPLAVNGNRWDYGPSWIRFEENRLVDWHNSPLHPLKISGTSADSPGR